MVGCLIIHGYTGGPYEVEPLITFLKEETDWDVLVPTLPGHGRKLALENISHKKWIEEAENAFIKLKERNDTIYVIGFSMGGMIAAYLAGKYKIDKLVLLAPAGKFISFKQITLDIGEVIVDKLKGELEENELYVRYRNKVGTIPFKANIEFVKLIKYTRKYLKEITSPVFIAQGQQDGIVPAKTVHYLDKEIHSKQKEIVLFERSDHLICLGEDKDALNEMIYSFLVNKETVY